MLTLWFATIVLISVHDPTLRYFYISQPRKYEKDALADCMNKLQEQGQGWEQLGSIVYRRHIIDTSDLYCNNNLYD